METHQRVRTNHPAVIVFVPDKLHKTLVPRHQRIPARLSAEHHAGGTIFCETDVVRGGKNRVEQEPPLLSGENQAGAADLRSRKCWPNLRPSLLMLSYPFAGRALGLGDLVGCYLRRSYIPCFFAVPTIERRVQIRARRCSRWFERRLALAACRGI